MVKLALIAPKVGFRTNNPKLMALVSGPSPWSPEQFWTGTGIGLLTVAALSPDWVDPVFIDENHEEVDLTADYDLVGITAMAQQAPRAYEIAAAFRKRGIPVVIGGVHATVLPDEAREHADAVVVGEAEPVWGPLMEDFRAGRLRPLYRSPGPINLADTPVPRYDLLNRNHYDQAWIQTSRGCPHDCDYCVSAKVFGNRYRIKSIDQVTRELDAVLAHFGKPRLAFSDDNLLANRAHAERLMEKLTPLRLRWLAQADVAIGERDDLLEKLRAANCRYLFIGFETLSPRSMAELDQTGWKVKRVEGLGRVDLIDRVVDGFLDPAQQRDHRFVGRRDPVPPVHHEDQHVGLRDRHLRLVPDQGQHPFVGARVEPARIHQSERTSPKGGLGVVAIARDPGHVVHDGGAMAENPVEQRGLPHVRPADNGDGRKKC